MVADLTTVDRQAIHEDLYRSFSDVPGYVAITVLPGGRTRWFPTDELDQAAAYATAAARRCNVYTCVATHNAALGHGRGGAADAWAIPAAFLDIDVLGVGHKNVGGRLPLCATKHDALALVDELPLKPTSIRDTGGGLLVEYKFAKAIVIDNEEDRRQTKAFLDGWNDLAIEIGKLRMIAVDKTSDAARLRRISGTLNHKATSPRQVRVVEEHPDRTWTVEAIRACIPKPEPGEPPEPKPIRARRVGDESPAELFTRAVEWDQILEPHGFVKMYEHGAAVYWRHAAASSPAGTPSAATNPNGSPVLVVFSESASAATKLPIGAGAKLTKFRAWAILNHDGDLKAAASAIRAIGRDGQ